MEKIFEILSSQNAPAWVQAFGAILAIFASYFIFSQQHKKELERAHEAGKQLRLSKIHSVIVIFDNINNTCQRIAKKIDSREAIWDLEMNFLSSQRDRLNSIPIFDLPSPILVSSVSNLISRLQVAEISLHQLNIETMKGTEITTKFFETIELTLHFASDFATIGADKARKIAEDEKLGDIDDFLLKSDIKILPKKDSYVSSFMDRITKKES
jgi:hypothetical protein